MTKKKNNQNKKKETKWGRGDHISDRESLIYK